MNEDAAGEDSVAQLEWLTKPLEESKYDSFDLLRRRELVVAFLGAGVSAGANRATTPDLIAEMLSWAEAATLQSLASETDSRVLADALIDAGLDRDELLDRLAIFVDSKKADASPLLAALTEAPSKLVVTLNYDLGVEDAAAEVGMPVVSLVPHLDADAAAVLQALSRRHDRTTLTVIHLHGSTKEPGSMALDSIGYSRLSQSGVFARTVDRLLSDFVLVFMGTRFDEQLLAAEVLGHREGGFPHLFVNKEEACRGLMAPPQSVRESSHLFVIRAYDSHEKLTALAEYIAAVEVEPVIPAAPIAAAISSAPTPYINSMLVPLTGGSEDSYAAFLIAAGERKGPEIETFHASGSRAVIVGAPGSGKTTLLRQIGATHDDGVRPILVRLASVSRVGNPRELLTEWAKRGEGILGEEAVSVEALSQRSFHLLLDGLDEVPSSQQEALAEKIVQLARANPTHLFSITSRPVPALALFERPEWQHVALEPDGNWATRFLASQDLTWDQLTKDVPALSDLREPLRIPFFLAAVVDLYRSGRLQDLSDLLDLVGRLIDETLEVGELPLDREATRRWLQDIALSMQLSQRTDVALDDLERIPLPAALNDAGGALELANLLVTARLFAPSTDGNYRFIHRIFGEALTGEALLRIEPEPLIAVVAPVVDRLSALRRDWLVPVSFAALRNREWRIALHNRDALAAARATPDDASTQERKEAARVIWDTYKDWRVWMWDYDRPSIVEDADVLARLLRASDLADERDTVLAGTSDDIKESRGNALRVLSLVGDRRIASQIRATLENLTEEPVMRRVAAKAATEFPLSELYYLIAHRALFATEDVEAQDMTYYAMDLATSGEFRELALRIATAPSGVGYLVLHRVREDLAPRDQLRFLFGLAQSGERDLSSTRELLVDLLPQLEVDGAVASELAFIVIAWHVVDDAVTVKAALASQAAAAAAGFVAYTSRENAYDYEVFDYLSWLPLEAWIEGGATEQQIKWRRQMEEMG